MSSGYKLNKKAVVDRSERIMNRTLYYIGGGVRTTMRRQLKVRGKKKAVSKPGEPPRIKDAKSPLKNLILFSVDKKNQKVVIGPCLHPKKGRGEVPLPRRLEHGGSATIRVRERRPRRVALGRDHYFLTRGAWERSRLSNGFLIWARANTYIRDHEMKINVEARPFVARALEQYQCSGGVMKAIERAIKSSR